MNLPSPSSPLRFIVRQPAPSLKNNRELFVGSNGHAGSRPAKEVTAFIGIVRGVVKRGLPKDWQPVALPRLCGLIVIAGAHAVTTIPDADADNLLQTVQEALQPPKVKRQFQPYQWSLVEDDRQFHAPWPFRKSFSVRESIFHEILFWVSDAGEDEYLYMAEMSAAMNWRKANDPTRTDDAWFTTSLTGVETDAF